MQRSLDLDIGYYLNMLGVIEFEYSVSEARKIIHLAKVFKCVLRGFAFYHALSVVEVYCRLARKVSALTRKRYMLCHRVREN